eukprot:6122919-Pleurochrysis_carterae.AAC.1
MHRLAETNAQKQSQAEGRQTSRQLTELLKRPDNPPMRAPPASTLARAELGVRRSTDPGGIGKDPAGGRGLE